MSYDSPRLSSEHYECGLPFTFDQFSRCSYGCSYCFAGPIKDSARDGEGLQKFDHVDVEAFKRMFTAEPASLSHDRRLIRQRFIDNRLVLHWGGLADPFDPVARGKMRHVTIALLRFLSEIKYPILFSTKGDFYGDAEIMELFRENATRWGTQHSIITYDPVIAAAVEERVPTPQERIKTMEALAKQGNLTILRLRPFSPGISTGSYVELIRASVAAGARAISTEFLCIPFAEFAFAKEAFTEMGRTAGFSDYVQMYRQFSGKKRGQPRLTREWKKPYVFTMYEEAKVKGGMVFGISDPDFKELNDTPGCCGLGGEMLEGGSVTTGQFTQAIRLAFRNGTVRWSEIAKDVEATLSGWGRKIGRRGQNDELRTLRQEDMAGYQRRIWNQPTRHSVSPFRFFAKAMVPCGVDPGTGDLVYAFVYKVGLYDSAAELARLGVGPGGVAEFEAQRKGIAPGEYSARGLAPVPPQPPASLPVLGANDEEAGCGSCPS